MSNVYNAHTTSPFLRSTSIDLVVLWRYQSVMVSVKIETQEGICLFEERFHLYRTIRKKSVQYV